MTGWIAFLLLCRREDKPSLQFMKCVAKSHKTVCDTKTLTFGGRSVGKYWRRVGNDHCNAVSGRWSNLRLRLMLTEPAHCSLTRLNVGRSKPLTWLTASSRVRYQRSLFERLNRVITGADNLYERTVPLVYYNQSHYTIHSHTPICRTLVLLLTGKTRTADRHVTSYWEKPVVAHVVTTH